MASQTPHKQGARRRDGGRSLVGQGMPGYRPVRSPLQSMGPSLAEAGRRKSALRHGVVVALVVTAAVAAIFALVGYLGREVVVHGSDSKLQIATIGLATGKPQPLTLASVTDTSQIEAPSFSLALPINLKAVTAIGYGSSDDPGALTLKPHGERANPSFWTRLTRRFLSTGSSSQLRYYVFGEVDQARSVCVGASQGAQVYAPLAGTVLSIAPQVVDGQRRGSEVQIQPLGDVETIVSVENIDADPGLHVGETVATGTSLLGTVQSMRGLETQPLAKYTHDAGDCALIVARDVPTDGSGL